MKFLIISIVFLAISKFCQGGPLRLQKRAAFYIANETACVVDETVYTSGDPIPTDDPCESCKCRPPGFACVLKECQVKPGCRAVRRAGHCCPEYVCGCEHNGRMYRDGDEIRDSKNPCYTCHCQGSSIACAFVDCFFRVDCSPEYVEGECCPRYPRCPSSPNVNSSFAADGTVNPDISTPILSETTAQPHDSSKISTPHPLEAEISLAVDSIDLTANEELAERNAGPEEEEDKETTPTAAQTTEDPELKKAYVEESGEGDISPHQVSGSTAAVSESNVEIFADEVGGENATGDEQGTTTAAVTNTEVDEEANTIEKTFRALKNFTDPESAGNEVHVETAAGEEQSESSDDQEQSESSESKDQSESSASDDQSESSGNKDESESSESPEDTPEDKGKKETSEDKEESETSDSKDPLVTPENQEQSESAGNKDEQVAAENREQSESTEKDQSHSAEPEATVTSQDATTAIQEIKTTEDADTASSVFDATTSRIEPTTKNPESLYYNGNKLPTTESSETVTAIVHVHDETSSQNSQEEKTTSVSKDDQTTFAAKSESDPSTTPFSNSGDASALATSEKPSETTESGTEKTESTN